MQIRPAQQHDHLVLLDIWQQSVRASHDFLSEQDIQSLLPIVRDMALPNLEIWVLCSDGTVPIGFMGLDGNKVEALFIAPSSFGQGGGTLMLDHARKLKGPLQVDVNEQNPRAAAFYLAHGFSIAGRSSTDAQGQAFPLLHLCEVGQDRV
ncbi:MAG: GNAT family N-acetyltransferase [Rhodocyclaceae bacterium]